MSIYRIRADYENFLNFRLTPDELQSKMGEDYLYFVNRKPQAQPDWVKPDATFELDTQTPSANALPDISYWTLVHPVLNQKAYDVLSRHLEGYGEFLPVSVEGKPYYIFNVLNVLDETVIDLDESEQKFENMADTKMFDGLEKLSFKEDKLKDTLLFKTEYDTYLKVYCGDKFKSLVEDADLTGLVFKTDLAAEY